MTPVPCPCCGASGPCYCSRNRPPVPRLPVVLPPPVPEYRRSRKLWPEARLAGAALACFGLSVLAMYADSWRVGNPAATDLAAVIFIPLALTFLWSLLALANLAAYLGRRAGRPQSPAPPSVRELLPPPLSVCVTPPSCPHPAPVPVNELDGPLREPGRLVAWLCPDCDAQLDPGFRASELRPDGSWPAVRRRVR